MVVRVHLYSPGGMGVGGGRGRSTSPIAHKPQLLKRLVRQSSFSSGSISVSAYQYQSNEFLSTWPRYWAIYEGSRRCLKSSASFCCCCCFPWVNCLRHWSRALPLYSPLRGSKTVEQQSVFWLNLAYIHINCQSGKIGILVIQWRKLLLLLVSMCAWVTDWFCCSP